MTEIRIMEKNTIQKVLKCDKVLVLSFEIDLYFF